MCYNARGRNGRSHLRNQRCLRRWRAPMADLVAVHPMDPRLDVSPHYDRVLAAVGFESRGPYVSKALQPKATRRIACAFADRQVGAFAANREWFVKAGFDYTVLKEGDAEQWSQNFI